MFRSTTPIVMIPGMGMDARMLQPQSNHFANFHVLALQKPQAASSLVEYATEIIDHWPKDVPTLISDKSSGIAAADQDQQRVYLGGVAYGGMLALEIATALKDKAHRIAGIILISSTRSRSNIPWSFRVQEKVIAATPATIGKMGLKRALSKMAADEKFSIDQAQLLRSIAHDVDWKRVRWEVKQIANWERTRNDFESLGIPIFQIHGRQDTSIIPPPKEDATLLVHGKHWINIAQSTEVNRWIEAIIRNYDLTHSFNA